MLWSALKISYILSKVLEERLSMKVQMEPYRSDDRYLIHDQGCALTKSGGSPVLWNYEIQCVQHMLLMKKLRCPSCPRAKVRHQEPPGAVRTQPWWYYTPLVCFFLAAPSLTSTSPNWSATKTSLTIQHDYLRWTILFGVYHWQEQRSWLNLLNKQPKTSGKLGV